MAPRIVYARSKQNQLAGIPMKPSGPISYPSWVALLRETAQYAPEVAAEGLGGFGKSLKKAVSKVTAPVVKPIAAAAAVIVKPIAPVVAEVTRPVVAIGARAAQVISPVTNAGKVVVGVGRGFVGKVIPGVAQKPPAPSQYPAQFQDGFVAQNQAEFDKHADDIAHMNPYSHRIMSDTELAQWTAAANNNWWVPANWNVGQPAPNQDQIDMMKSADYGDGYRPASQSEFAAYVAAVDKANATQSTIQPTTIMQTKAEPAAPVSNSGIAPVTMPSDQPLTIDQAKQIAAPPATSVQPTVMEAIPTATAAPLTIAAANTGTQTDPPKAASSAPIGLLAAAAAGVFFLFKK